MLRFLRFSKFDVAATIEKLKFDHSFRGEYDSDNLIDDFNCTELPEIMKHWTKAYVGVTKNGSPLYVEKSGMVDGQKLMASATKRRLK